MSAWQDCLTTSVVGSLSIREVLGFDCEPIDAPLIFYRGQYRSLDGSR
ncbi:hypothetical protein J2Y55_000294 [Bosea sp. BE125]|nr:hypothetical protein [Bosea sp. BE125]